MKGLSSYEILKRVLYRAIGTRATRKLRIYSPTTLLSSLRMRRQYASFFKRAQGHFTGKRVEDDAWSQRGFRIFRQAFALSPSFLDAVEEQFALQHSLSFKDGLTEPGTDPAANYTYLSGVGLHELKVGELVAAQAGMLDELEEHLGSHVRINHISIYKTYPGGFAEAYSFLWHRDNQPANSFKLFVYLTDVSDVAGPLQVGPGTHKSGVAFPRFGESRCGAPPSIETFEGRAGDAILFNVNVVHCGGRAEQKERVVMVVSLTPSLDPWRDFLVAHGFGTLPETQLEYHPDPSRVFW